MISRTVPFNGILEGNNHRLINLVLNHDQDLIVGLVGILGTHGRIQNLQFISPSVTGYSIVGVVAGISNGAIENVSIENGSVTSTMPVVPIPNGLPFAGAVVGIALNGSIAGTAAPGTQVNGGTTGNPLAGGMRP